MRRATMRLLGAQNACAQRVRMWSDACRDDAASTPVMPVPLVLRLRRLRWDAAARTGRVFRGVCSALSRSGPGVMLFDDRRVLYLPDNVEGYQRFRADARAHVQKIHDELGQSAKPLTREDQWTLARTGTLLCAPDGEHEHFDAWLVICVLMEVFNAAYNTDYDSARFQADSNILSGLDDDDKSFQDRYWKDFGAYHAANPKTPNRMVEWTPRALIKDVTGCTDEQLQAPNVLTAEWVRTVLRTPRVAAQ